MKNAILIGNLSYNINLFLNTYPLENSTISIVKKTKTLGNTLNTSVILSKYGINTYYFSNVGDDLEGKEIINYLHSNLINSEFINIVNNNKTNKNYIIRNLKNNSKTKIYEKNNYKYELSRQINFIPDIIYNDSLNIKLLNDLKLRFKSTKIVTYIDQLNEEALDVLKLSDYIIIPLKFAEILSNIKLQLSNKRTIIDVYLKTKRLFNGIIIIYDENLGSIYENNNILNIVPKLGNKSLVKENSFNVFKATFIYSILEGYDLDKNIKLSTFAKFLCDNNKTILDIKEVVRLYEENS